MREWLDHRGVEPSTFRYTFTAPGILFRVDFAAEAMAVAFAREFGGRSLSRAEEPVRLDRPENG